MTSLLRSVSYADVGVMHEGGALATKSCVHCSFWYCQKSE